MNNMYKLIIKVGEGNNSYYYLLLLLLCIFKI